MKTVIEMAREAGFHVGDQFVAGASEAELERFAALVAAAEREACAKIVENSSLPDAYSEPALVGIAEEIRARGQA